MLWLIHIQPKPTSTTLWPKAFAAQSLSAGNPSVWFSISLGKSIPNEREGGRGGVEVRKDGQLNIT